MKTMIVRRVAPATRQRRRVVVPASVAGAALVLGAAFAGPRPAAGAGVVEAAPFVTSPDEWIAPSVRVGRNELQISRFTDPRTADAVLAELLDDWRRRAAPVMQRRDGRWLVAVQADGAWVETVRLMSDGSGSAGLRIRQRTVPGARSGIDAPGLDRWLDARRVISRTEQRDGAQVVTSWVLFDDAAADTVLEHLRSVAIADGFGPLAERRAAGNGGQRRVGDDAPAAGTVPSLWLRRRSDELLLTVTPHAAGSLVALHWSRRR